MASTLTPADIDRLRADFPILARKVYDRPLVYLDNTASTQTPRPVVEAVTDMYYSHKANVHRGVHRLSQEATEMMEATRRAAADFIGAASTDEIIFTRGTTEAINLVAASYGALLHEGDEVILSVMEHHSNIVPWQLLRERKGIVIKVIPMHPDGSLDMEAYKALLSERTKVVAITHVSNVLGTVNPVAEIAALAHQAGAVCLIDGAQAIAHLPVNVEALGADFYVFSSHKMYGPCGVGVLYGRRHLLEIMPPYQGGGEMISHVSFAHTTWADLPFKFEAGTPDYVDIAAFSAAMAYIKAIGLEAIAAHEEALLHHASRRIAFELPMVRIYGTAPGKSAIISFNLGKAHPYDTGMLLDKLGIACRTGHHCAQPLMEALGIEGTVRASFALYNTLAEADALIDGLHRIAPLLT
ncbi:MAG: cysteine desulfurase [Pseudoflavonifractor sp.]|nr:cysteine desulfurase [Alloprevotella sp.]MCM1117008.1 cysteine desulfurase [Pseudoflavonifractor sp.]